RTYKIHTLSLHDALPIYTDKLTSTNIKDNEKINNNNKENLDNIDENKNNDKLQSNIPNIDIDTPNVIQRGYFNGELSDISVLDRSEEHTSELQSREISYA